MINESTQARMISWFFMLYASCLLIAMAFMNISFFLIAALVIYSLLFLRKKIDVSDQIEFKSYVRYGAFLFSACLLSLIVAKIFPVVYAGHAPEVTLHGFLKIWYLLSPAVLFAGFIEMQGTEERIKVILRSWFGMTIVLSIVAIIQYNTGWPLKQPITTNPGHFHAILFLGHYLSTASILIFPTFAALCLSIGSYSRSQKVMPFEWIVSLSGLIILFLSYARAAWLSVPLGILFLFMRYLKPRTRLVSGLIFLILLGGATQTSFMKERIERTYGVSERVRLWRANIDFFERNPLTGIGWLKTQEMSEFYFKEKDPANYKGYFWGHAHSNFFEMLGGTGLIGLAAFLAWSFFSLRLAYRTSKLARENGKEYLSDLAFGLFTALLLLHLNGLTNVTFWEGKVMHSQMFAIGLLLMIQWLLTKRSF